MALQVLSHILSLWCRSCDRGRGRTNGVSPDSILSLAGRLLRGTLESVLRFALAFPRPRDVSLMEKRALSYFLFGQIESQHFETIICRWSRDRDQPLDGLSQYPDVPFHFLVVRGHKVWAKGSEVVEYSGYIKFGQRVDISTSLMFKFHNSSSTCCISSRGQYSSLRCPFHQDIAASAKVLATNLIFLSPV